MGRIPVLALVLAAGCAREPLEDPSIQRAPPSLIPGEGASLYVLEGPAGWLQEDLKLVDPDPVPSLGTPALATALRYALSHRQIRFIGHADFQPTSGWPTEATLFNPDAEGHGPGSGGSQVGFKVALTAWFADPKSVKVEWKAEQLTISRPAPGAASRTDAERIDSGAATIPYGKSIVMSRAKEGGREYTLLLRMASLRDP